jgi:hypothetical protein
VVELLLARDSDPNHQTFVGETPLHVSEVPIVAPQLIFPSLVSDCLQERERADCTHAYPSTC